MRHLVLRTLFAALALLTSAFVGAAEIGKIHREVFLAAPKPGVAVLAATYATRPSGGELLSLHQLMSRSDTVDIAFMRRSDDGGRTWSDAIEIPTLEHRPGGKLRRALRGGVADPRSGRFVRFHIEGLLPNDDPLEGMRQWYVCYSVSPDGGRTWPVGGRVIQDGPEFSEQHPLPGVWIGKNCVMVGDLSSVPVFLRDGTLLVPVIITPIGPDGTYHNPGGGYTYSDAAALRGRWREDGRLSWELSGLIKADPARSTRGMDEPTFAELPDGTVLAVLRGSNHTKPQLPAYRWASRSNDGGRTWSAPEPWTFDDGVTFFSPSSCSQLVPHSSGRLFWVGNISPNNADGNRPRYPLVIGEVDVRSGRLLRATVRPIDDRGPEDSEMMSLSNFSAREDRADGAIVVNLSRLFQRSKPGETDWTSDAYLYRVTVN